MGGLAPTPVILGFVLGATGVISGVAKVVPRSIITGLRLGLGAALVLLAFSLMAETLWIGAVSLGLTLALYRSRLPSGIVVLAAGLLFRMVAGAASPDPALRTAPAGLALCTTITDLVLPQIALTLTDAVVLTALVAGDFIGPAAVNVTPRRLCLTSGLLNCELSPFGALLFLIAIP